MEALLRPYSGSIEGHVYVEALTEVVCSFKAKEEEREEGGKRQRRGVVKEEQEREEGGVHARFFYLVTPPPALLLLYCCFAAVLLLAVTLRHYLRAQWQGLALLFHHTAAQVYI